MASARLLAPTAVLAAVLLAGCSSSRSSGGTGPANPAPRSGGDATGGARPAPPDRPLEFAACVDGPCMVHPRTGAYHRCLHAAGGVCFTYGSPCAPADRCVFDPVAGAYRECRRPLAGTCAELGDPCTPKDACVLDPTAGRHRTCEAPTAGGCGRYGAACEPG